MYFDANKVLKMLFVAKHVLYATKEHLYMHDLYIKMFLEAQLIRLYKLESGGVLHETVIRESSYFVNNCTTENTSVDDK